MNNWLYIIIGALLLVCIVLIIRIYLIKKSIKETEKSLENILKTDTNNLITVSDKSVKNLASFLNRELKNLRKERFTI